jgi:hypothetical protein
VTDQRNEINQGIAGGDWQTVRQAERNELLDKQLDAEQAWEYLQSKNVPNLDIERLGMDKVTLVELLSEFANGVFIGAESEYAKRGPCSICQNDEQSVMELATIAKIDGSKPYTLKDVVKALSPGATPQPTETEREKELRGLYPHLDEDRFWDEYVRKKQEAGDYREPIYYRGEIMAAWASSHPAQDQRNDPEHEIYDTKWKFISSREVAAGDFRINLSNVKGASREKWVKMARLIVVAPEMLEVLEAIVDSATDGRPNPEWLNERLVLASAVVQKAKRDWRKNEQRTNQGKNRSLIT